MIRRAARLLLQNGVLSGSATSLAIRFAAAVLGFLMFALASRHMGPEMFGAVAVTFNAMSFLSVAALCGQETLIVRSWAEYCRTDRPGLARGALTFGVQITLGALTLVAMVAALAWSLWDRTVSLPLVLAGCAFLICHGFLQFSGQFARVAAGLIVGEVPRELVWRLILFAVIGVHHLMNIAFGATEFFLVAAASLAVAIAIQVAQVVRIIPAAVIGAQPQRDFGTWAPRSFKMWLSALMDTTGQYLEVVAVGLVLGPTLAGFYFVATRITSVFAMITGSITIYALPQISELFYSNAQGELQRILRMLAVIGAVLIGSTLLLIIVLGKLLLWMFGADYVAIYPALIVLAVGASIGGLVGPAAHILLLTGHEGTYPRIMALGLLARFLMIVLLGNLFGLIGVTTGIAISVALTAAALILACRRLVGLDPSLSFALARIHRSLA